MKPFKIGYTPEVKDYYKTTREEIDITEIPTDFVDISAVVIKENDEKWIKAVEDTCFDIPIFQIDLSKNSLNDIQSNTLKIEELSLKYEESLIPPFLKSMMESNDSEQIMKYSFCTPGHQHGTFFKMHPVGYKFYDFLGENVFKNDYSASYGDLGDIGLHHGSPGDALKLAKELYNCDRIYFTLNGTSGSNAIVAKALLSDNDIILFDRNNHKSVHNEALIQIRGIPIFLETNRNDFGLIGGVYQRCWDEAYIRERIKKKCGEERSKLPRPIRLAVIQLGTYDGTITNPRYVISKIGKLCDYILFDSAWLGYESFISVLKDISPMNFEYSKDDPGIVVTQSVHKMQAGFSQSSQILKKDKHLKGQKRYCGHKRFNMAYLMYCSTSPCYPIFASNDINWKMHSSKGGKRIWEDELRIGINARKRILKECKYMRPFVPKIIDDKKWEEYETEEIATDKKFWLFNYEKPDDGVDWHGFEGYGDMGYMIDPMKLLIVTQGIDTQKHGYLDFGIPACVLDQFVYEKGITSEKKDLYSIEFLLTPGRSTEILDYLVDALVEFEKYIDKNEIVENVCPKLYKNYPDVYKEYTIRSLCQDIHDHLKTVDAPATQRKMFKEEFFPEMVMSPRDANTALVKNNCKLVPIKDIVGKIALEGALPYPPGIICVVPGEKWTEIAKNYFLTLQNLMNNYPGFTNELQGVHFKKTNENQGELFAYVYYDEEEEKKKENK